MRIKSGFITRMLLLIVIAFSMTELAANDDLEQLNIIDWHVHVAGLGHGESGNFINEKMYNNYRFKFFLKWMNVTEEELEKRGEHQHKSTYYPLSCCTGKRSCRF